MNKIIIALLLTLSFSAQAKKPRPEPIPEPSIIVFSTDTYYSIIRENADQVRPMASITKLMTAMVALDKYQLTDRVATGKKTSATVEQLLTETLVRSSNVAAEQLAKHYPGGRTAFIQQMNYKAQALGLLHTRYDDASGLLPGNVSTARELVSVVASAGQYPFIRQVSRQPEIYKQVGKKKIVTINNTNKTILVEFDNILVSKTGTTSKAGKCLALLVDNQGEEFVIIILGEPTKAARDNVARQLLSTTKERT